MDYLAIDTTTRYLRILLSRGGRVEYFCDEAPLSHSVSLVPRIREMLGDRRYEGIGCIGVNIGPGSFTGIRIGVTTAKTLAYFAKIPLVPINSLELAAYIVYSRDSVKAGQSVCPVIDGSNTLYSARYTFDGNALTETAAPHMSSAEEILKAAQNAVFCGDIHKLGMAKDGIDDYCARLLRYMDDAVRGGKLVPAEGISPLYIQKSQAEKNLADKGAKA